MTLTALLEERRERILARWFEQIANSYPRVTSQFLTGQKDPFRNPVGHAITQSIGMVFDQLVSAMDTDELLRSLDGIVRIRSVQDFKPSQAVAFALQLREVVREVLDDQVVDDVGRRELADLDSRIDRIALLAFDKYTACREKLHEVRRNQIERQAIMHLQRPGGNPALSRRTQELSGEADRPNEPEGR